ncbi:MAG TPA: hypothetical protein VFD36_20540 [Kofleriaceae bacterium]|nr:hypothetical protein [Kofleriaceae bacterium]
MKGRLFLNADHHHVRLDIWGPDGAGMSIQLNEKFKTPELALQMAQTIAKRLGLRKQGSGWQRRIK